ncbi:MATE family efflux transporter [Ignatzschineria sp. LJL83]
MNVSILSAWRNLSLQKKVWALTLPMILSNISVPLVGTVDTIIVGHLSNADDMASVGIGSSIYLFLVAILNFLRMGTTGFTAQAYGNQDGMKIRQILLQGLLLALGLAFVLAIFAIPISNVAFMVMKPSPELLAGASQFFYWRLLGIPAALMNFALIGWFLGMQTARIPFYMLIATNVVNICLTLLFILQLEMGMVGVAKAAVIAEWVGLIIGLSFLPSTLKKSAGNWQFHPLKKWRNWKPLLFVNRDIFIRSLILHFVFFLVTIQGTRLGGNTVAANMIILNGLLIMAYLLDGFAHAIEALTGKAIGEKHSENLFSIMIIAGGWALFISLLFMIAFSLFGRNFIDLISDIPEVRSTAYPLIPYLTLLPIISVWSYLLDGLFIGATKAKEMRNAMLLAFLCALPMGFLLLPLQNNGLWITFLLFMFLRGVIMSITALRIQKHNGWIS